MHCHPSFEKTIPFNCVTKNIKNTNAKKMFKARFMHAIKTDDQFLFDVGLCDLIRCYGSHPVYVHHSFITCDN